MRGPARPVRPAPVVPPEHSDARSRQQALNDITRSPQRVRTRALASYTRSCIFRMGLKPLAWVGSALEDLRALPETVRRQVGFELHQVQLGFAVSDWRPLPSVGAGVVELRIHAAGEHRVLYIGRYAVAIHVLHVFEKKTRKITRRDLELARTRLSWVRDRRHFGSRESGDRTP
jgi:phage-related protein